MAIVAFRKLRRLGCSRRSSILSIATDSTALLPSFGRALTNRQLRLSVVVRLWKFLPSCIMLQLLCRTWVTLVVPTSVGIRQSALALLTLLAMLRVIDVTLVRFYKQLLSARRRSVLNLKTARTFGSRMLALTIVI